MAGARLKRLSRWLINFLTDSGSTNKSSMMSWRANVKGCDIQRLSISFWSCVGYVGLGAALVIFGPTVLDLGQQLDVSVGLLSVMLLCRAVGSAVGSVGAGVALDKLHKYSYIIMCGIFLSSSATTVVVPLSVNIYMLAVIMFINGVATGALDSGTHAVLMKLWKEKSGPCMQVLHFAFALGAFLAPVIAKGFISEDLQDDGNSTCVGSSQDFNFSLINSTTSVEDNGSRFRIAYWISSSFFIPTMLAYTYYAVKINVVERCRKKREGELILNPSYDAEPSNDAEEDCEIEPEDITNGGQSLILGENHSAPEDNEERTSREISATSYRQPRLFKIIILALLASFLFVYVGLEVAYGSWIFTVVVKGALNFCKKEGTKVQSLFWGTFAFARLFSVLLAVLRVKASVMMAGNLFGSMIAAVIMVSAPHSIPAIWLASAVLGMSYASIYPTTMTWMSETVEATGTATAVLVTGGILGDISIPAVMGVIIAKVRPDSLFYFTFVGIVLSAGLVSVMFLVAYLQRKKQHHFLKLNSELVDKENDEEGETDATSIINQNSHL